MKILVTGATGLLGNHIARELFRQGHQVKALVRPTSDLRSLTDVPCEFVYGDLSGDTIAKAIGDVDGVIHSAALTASGITALSHYEESNVKGTIRLVEAMQKGGCRRLVFVSTANTLGPGSKEVPGTELSPFALSDFNSGYVNSKYLAEQFVLKSNGQKGLEAVVVNPTFMIGSHDYKPSSGQLILHGLRNVQICPPGGKNFVHVRDAARGVCQAFFKGKPGQNYLLAGENLTYAEFFDKLGKIAGHKPFRLKIPRPLFHLGGLAGSWAAKITRKDVPFNYVNARLLALDNYYSAQKAREELGMPFTPIDEAIREAVDWFKKNAYLST